jgi:hypothetical protein
MRTRQSQHAVRYSNRRYPWLARMLAAVVLGKDASVRVLTKGCRSHRAPHGHSQEHIHYTQEALGGCRTSCCCLLSLFRGDDGRVPVFSNPMLLFNAPLLHGHVRLTHVCDMCSKYAADYCSESPSSRTQSKVNVCCAVAGVHMKNASQSRCEAGGCAAECVRGMSALARPRSLRGSRWPAACACDRHRPRALHICSLLHHLHSVSRLLCIASCACISIDLGSHASGASSRAHHTGQRAAISLMHQCHA